MGSSIIPSGISLRIPPENKVGSHPKIRWDPTWDTPGIPGGIGGIPPYIFTCVRFAHVKKYMQVTVFNQPDFHIDKSNSLKYLVLP